MKERENNTTQRRTEERAVVSILIPCYCSEQYLENTVTQIKKEFSDVNNETDLAERKQYDYQIILVNDGSPDGTGNVIRNLCEIDSGIVGVDLKDNMGQNKAIIMGYGFVTGDYLVCMDDDGQHPPEAIFRFIRKLNEGYDLVFAQYPKLKEPLLRRIASRITDIMLSLLSRKPFWLRDTSYLALNRSSIEILQEIDEYCPLLCQTLAPYSVRIGTIAVDHREREQGKSTYSLRKLLQLWLAVIFSIKTKVQKDKCVRI